MIDLTVEQVRAGGPVKAFGYLTPTICDGTWQRYEVTLPGAGSQRFKKGPATWSASGYVEGDTGLQHVSVPPTRIALTR